MECLPAEVALAVLEDEDGPLGVELLDGDLLEPEKPGMMYHPEPKKVALQGDIMSWSATGRQHEGLCDLAMPKPPPHAPPPEMPPALPRSLSSPDPPTPPPFVPALQPAQEPTLPLATSPPARPPAPLPPLLPPSLPEALPACPPPPFPPSLPPTHAAAPASLEPQVLFTPGGVYCDGEPLLSRTATTRAEPGIPAAFRWYPALHGTAGILQRLRGECQLRLDASSQAGHQLASQPRVETTFEVTNPGSVLHGTGDCHPCAWFWKLPGCRNGAQCDHCHLCPEGEVKARKKARQTIKRLGFATPHKSLTPQEDASSPVQEKTPSAPLASFGSSELESTTGSASDREWMVGSSGSEHELPGDSDCEDPAAPPLLLGTPPPPPGLEPPEGLPSRGSALHDLGECNPCAWFWKAVGCHNGRDCAFCHACPQGAAKARKKSRRSKGTGEGGVPALPAVGCQA
mmetsp:Transcript_39409/g.117994  ORF Transcript_39409/g.117994 Transcript_39409/m.117994 type:complete len:458 (-) Transcript_39409:94-1467(-)